MFRRAGIWCLACGRRARSAGSAYRGFLLDPGTLFTAATLVLLAAAVAIDPGGAIGRGDGRAYLAPAVVGSLFIWWSALQGIRERDFTADIPVSLATAGALAIGEYAAAAIVAGLLLAGGLLEEAVAARADRALDALEGLLPERVTVRRGGREQELALEEVAVGDVVLARPGERIAVDGEVVDGRTDVDQAAITGESALVARGPGDGVFAGSLAVSGAVDVRAAQVGEDTTLGHVRRLVAQAGERKAPVERILDRWAMAYTPAALVLAGLLWALTGDPVRAITMLIVFCPCVMVLATPTALVASIGNAALRGSLVKRGAVVEALAAVDCVVFDKTGTLTEGRPRLADVVALDGLAADEVLRLAAAAEERSEHPLGRAIAAGALGRQLTVPEPEQFSVDPGQGVSARVEGRLVEVGRPCHGDGLPERPARGATVVEVRVDGRLAGRIALEDTLRPGAFDVVGRLRAGGSRVLLVSGDEPGPAHAIAAGVGIDDVTARALPHDKAAIGERLQADGRRVLVVGDGINDGPALATADVGVAMGATGTDLALEAADVALLRDDLDRLPALLDLSRTALRAIRQNLAFSLLVLVAAVALTIPGILTPVSGALLHELSSLPVIANSARLLGRRERA